VPLTVLCSLRVINHSSSHLTRQFVIVVSPQILRRSVHHVG
jgi:hypothetical protein